MALNSAFSLLLFMMLMNGCAYYMTTSGAMVQATFDNDGNQNGTVPISLISPVTGKPLTSGNFTVLKTWNPNSTSATGPNDNTLLGNVTHAVNSSNTAISYPFTSATFNGMAQIEAVWSFTKFISGGYIAQFITVMGVDSKFTTFVLWPAFGLVIAISVISLLKPLANPN